MGLAPKFVRRSRNQGAKSACPTLKGRGIRMSRPWSAGLVAVCVGMSASVAADPDSENCKDVFVTRLAGFHILQCSVKTFDAYTFAEGTPKETRVEGRIVETVYNLDDGRDGPSALAVRRNYENVFKQAGWTVVYADNDVITATQTKSGEQRWLQLIDNQGTQYELIAALKGELELTVTTADGMLNALNQDGHVALQINFDTGKATIRPDSLPVVAQIVSLLQENPKLKLSVEGYTDNVGDPKANKSLSEARAKAVVAAVVAKGIAASRLTASGFGQDKPVADNATEDGRAKNRRVELVKR